MPPPRASVPVWADLHRATMHVAGAVASQRWDRPAQKRRLLRQHMAIEECGLQGGRSSTCVARRPGLATPPKNSRCTAIWTLTPPFFFFTARSHKWANGAGRAKLFRRAFRGAESLWDQSSPADPAHLLTRLTCWPGSPADYQEAAFSPQVVLSAVR